MVGSAWAQREAMPITDPNPWYVPPAFPLFELDDTQLAVDPDIPARRGFHTSTAGSASRPTRCSSAGGTRADGR